MSSTPSSRSDADVSRRTQLSVALGALAAIFIAAAALGDRPAQAGSAPTAAVAAAIHPLAARIGLDGPGGGTADPSLPPAAEALSHRTFDESEAAPTF